MLAEVEGDDDLRALILTGSDGVFSARRRQHEESRAARRGPDEGRGAPGGFLQTVLARLSRLPPNLLSIAAVEGPAVGVAWGMALTCDFVVAARDAASMAPFLRAASVPDGGLAFHLVKGLGRLRATEILLSNRTLSSIEAFDAGLVSEVAPPGEALARAIAIAEAVGRASRDATALTLYALRRASCKAATAIILGRRVAPRGGSICLARSPGSPRREASRRLPSPIRQLRTTSRDDRGRCGRRTGDRNGRQSPQDRYGRRLVEYFPRAHLPARSA